MITAKELKDWLKDIPDDTPIVMQDDDEGNGYRWMRGIEFIPPDNSGANYFDEEERICYRQSDFDDDDEEVDESLILCAVVF